MRYLEFKNGQVILAPRRGVGHVAMLHATARSIEDVASAGFLTQRAGPGDRSVAFGQSVGLSIAANPHLSVPEKLYVGRHLALHVFATDVGLISHLDDVELAWWGMTRAHRDDASGPIYAPQHSNRWLTTEDYIQD